jgi:hypothetical protein
MFITALFQEKGVRGWVSFAQRFENAERKGKKDSIPAAQNRVFFREICSKNGVFCAAGITLF